MQITATGKLRANGLSFREIFHLQAVARLTSKSGFFLLQNTQFILSRVKPVAAKVNVYFMNSRHAFLRPL